MLVCFLLFLFCFLILYLCALVFWLHVCLYEEVGYPGAGVRVSCHVSAGIERVSSGRAANALNCWVIYLSNHFLLDFWDRVFAWLSWNYYVEQTVLNPQRSSSLCLLCSGIKGMHHHVWHILLFLTNYSSRGACFPNTEAECQLPFIHNLIICFKYVPVLTQPACSI